MGKKKRKKGMEWMPDWNWCISGCGIDVVRVTVVTNAQINQVYRVTVSQRLKVFRGAFLTKKDDFLGLIRKQNAERKGKPGRTHLYNPVLHREKFVVQWTHTHTHTKTHIHARTHTPSI